MSLFPSRLTVPFSLFWLVFILIALTIWVVGLWGLSWLVRVIITLAAFFISRYQQEPSKPVKPWTLLYLGIEPVAIGLSLALILFNIPTSIRLKLSESALTSYVREVQAGRRSSQAGGDPTRRVGLFDVKETELLDGGIVRLITTEDFVDHAGFVYSPQQQPPVRGEDSYRHLYGSWWHWQRSW
jgi:hypothetical protein